MSTYTGSFDKQASGLEFIDRSAEGYLEIVYQQCFDTSQPRPYDCGPYTLTITKDGAPFSVTAIPHHFYEASWWVDLVPVTTILRGPAALIAGGYVPPFGATSTPVGLPVAGSATFGGPMTVSSDVTGYEPTTGGRGDIGIMTANSAAFMLTGDSRNMLVDAMTAATQPIWDYDNARPIDLIAKPMTTHYFSGAQGGPPFWLGPFPTNPSDIRPVPNPLPPSNPSTPDTAHMAELCGVAAMATGAPRYVRWLQMRTIRGFDEDNAPTGQYGGSVSVFGRQTRGTAWLLRELFYCYQATLLAEQAGNLPADCLPSSVFKHIIDNQVTQFTTYIEPDPFFKAFGVWCGQNTAWWQCDMINQVLGLYAQAWPAEWGPIYIKTIRNLMARVNGDGLKQWPVAFPTWYWGWLGPDANTPFSGFPELWQKWSAGQAAGTDPAGLNGQLTAAQVAALDADPTNGMVYVNPSEYQSWLYGALAFAVYLDRGALKGAVSAAFPNLEQAFAQQDTMLQKFGYLIAQCSISVTPQVVVPIPPIQPPSEIHMPTTASLKVGQTVQLDLHGVVPPDGDLSTLTYKAVPDGIVSVLKNATGVQIKGLKAGMAKVIGDVNGVDANGNPATVETECDATVSASVPLVSSLGTLDQVS